jgi:fructokinase
LIEVPGAMGQAAAVVQPGGTVVAMASGEQATATQSARSIATRGIRLVGAGPYPPRLFEVALGLAGDLPLEILVTHELPLALAADAFALLGVGPASGYQAGKVLLADWADSAHAPQIHRAQHVAELDQEPDDPGPAEVRVLA